MEGIVVETTPTKKREDVGEAEAGVHDIPMKRLGAIENQNILPRTDCRTPMIDLPQDPQGVPTGMHNALIDPMRIADEGILVNGVRNDRGRLVLVRAAIHPKTQDIESENRSESAEDPKSVTNGGQFPKLVIHRRQRDELELSATMMTMKPAVEIHGMTRTSVEDRRPIGGRKSTRASNNPRKRIEKKQNAKTQVHEMTQLVTFKVTRAR